MKSKGMRDVRTVQSLRNRAIPANRSEMVVQLARLENERTRLERELKIWTDKQEDTQEGLARAVEQIDALQKALYGEAVQEEDALNRGSAPPQTTKGQSTKDQRSAEEKANSCRVVSLEY